MSFEVSVSDKLRLETIRADGQWSGPRIIAGKTAWPVTAGNRLFSIDLYGLQASDSKVRTAGTLRVRFIRFPSMDVFSYFDIPIDPKFVDWSGGRTAVRVAVAGTFDAVGIEMKTHVTGLQIRDRVLIVGKLPA